MFSVLLPALLLLQYVSAIEPGFPYGSEKVRGVNLGGWLVLEPWITPNLFDATGDDRIIDEYTFCQHQDRAVASSKLKSHWDTWITESDFAAIAAAGLNHVRVPIGYWAYDITEGEPWIGGQVEYLEKAVVWAERYKLKVIVDLHGVPGSQNGYDNSGQLLPAPTWHTKGENIQRSNVIIKKMAARFRDQKSVVPIIAPLNEPGGWFSQEFLETTKQFWRDSYGNIRFPYDSDRKSDIVSLIHDSFQPLSYWAGFQSSANGWDGVAMDTHIYQMFYDAGNAMTEQQHIDDFCRRGGELSSFHLWTIVGEWTPSPNDCAKYLNGRGVGARYDGTRQGSTRVGSCNGLTGKASTFGESYKTFLRKMWEAQVTTYEKGAGWIMWTWKTEMTDEWSYQAGLANGWIPKDPTQRNFRTICG